MMRGWKGIKFIFVSVSLNICVHVVQHKVFDLHLFAVAYLDACSCEVLTADDINVIW